MLRHMVMRLAHALLLLLVVGCTAEADVNYFVSYVDPAAYEGAAEDAALDRCAALEGAERAGQADSLPPGVTLTFSGSRKERDAFEDCLRSLSNVRIIGPAEEGDPSPPQLVGLQSRHRKVPLLHAARSCRAVVKADECAAYVGGEDGEHDFFWDIRGASAISKHGRTRVA